MNKPKPKMTELIAPSRGAPGRQGLCSSLHQAAKPIYYRSQQLSNWDLGADGALEQAASSRSSGLRACIYPLACYNNGYQLGIVSRSTRAGMSESQPKAKRRRQAKYTWKPDTIRALREHMGLTQREMADELEVRQQTISEWETGLHTPHRSTQKTLNMVAEHAGFRYEDSLNLQARVDD